MMVVAGCAVAAAVLAAQGMSPEDQSGEPSVPVVGLVCSWSAFTTYDESIVIDLSDRVAYWVNQNRPLHIAQLNAGRVVLTGVRDRVRVSQSRVEKEVALRMIIDRISGTFFVQQQVYRQVEPGRCRRSRLF